MEEGRGPGCLASIAPIFITKKVMQLRASREPAQLSRPRGCQEEAQGPRVLVSIGASIQEENSGPAASWVPAVGPVASRAILTRHLLQNL